VRSGLLFGRCGVQLDFIRPGEPAENVAQMDARAKSEAWRADYNHDQPMAPSAI
jgi:hypothetical protein